MIHLKIEKEEVLNFVCQFAVKHHNLRYFLEYIINFIYEEI